MMGIKEVAITDTAEPGGSCKRGAAQHQLIDHELAVVLAERALDRPIAGGGRIGAAGPLPHDPERIVEVAGAGGDLPLHLAPPTLAAPPPKPVRLILPDMADPGGRSDP